MPRVHHLRRRVRPTRRIRPRVRIALGLGLAGLALGACTSTLTGQGVADGPASSATPSPSSGASSSTASSPAPAGGSATPSIAPIGFGGCSGVSELDGIDVSNQFSVTCARLSVPLDYTRPDGQKITLQLVRIHDRSDSSPTGSLLTDPGGPGGTGVDFAAELASYMAPVLAHFDLIGFDPRGVGLSSPVVCDTPAEEDQATSASPLVNTAAGYAQAQSLAAQFAARCSAKYGSSLGFYNTVNTVRDMDLIRQAVGDKQFNYIGFSYGTELGAQYAHLFPSTVRGMVLDGAVDPLTDPVATFAGQIGGFEKSFDQFAASCAKQSSCAQLGNPRQVVYDITAQTEKSPMPTGTARPLTQALALTGVLEALYGDNPVTTLGPALLEARNGNGAGLLQLADAYNQRSSDGTYANLIDAENVINCNDQAAGQPTTAKINATITAWIKDYPMFGLWAAAGLFSCQNWPTARTVPPEPIAPTATKVLVVGNLNDPATPYQGAIDLTKTMGNAELLSWNGEGHTSYLSGNSCVRTAVNDYLLSLTLPAANTTCPP